MNAYENSNDKNQFCQFFYTLADNHVCTEIIQIERYIFFENYIFKKVEKYSKTL